MGWISSGQFERDHAGHRNHCAACGHDGNEANPLVLDNDGFRIHRSHTEDAASGCFGTQQDDYATTFDDDGRRYTFVGPRGISPVLDKLSPNADHHTIAVYGSADLARRVQEANQAGECVAWQLDNGTDDDTDGA